MCDTVLLLLAMPHLVRAALKSLCRVVLLGYYVAAACMLLRAAHTRIQILLLLFMLVFIVLMEVTRLAQTQLIKIKGKYITVFVFNYIIYISHVRYPSCLAFTV